MAAAVRLLGLPVVESGIRERPQLSIVEDVEWLDESLLVDEERVDFDHIVSDLSRTTLPPIVEMPRVVVPEEEQQTHPTWQFAFGLACASLMTGIAITLALTMLG
jgi:hypothetical protein